MNSKSFFCVLTLVSAMLWPGRGILEARSYSPWVVSEHVADFSGNWHSFMQHEAFRGKRDHELAVAVWKYLCSRQTGLVHTGSWDEPTRTTDQNGKPDPWGNPYTYWTVYDPVKNYMKSCYWQMKGFCQRHMTKFVLLNR